MQRTMIKQALASTAPLDGVLVRGWVRTRRDAKGFSFLEINDGSCLANIQVIVDDQAPAHGAIKSINTGASVEVEGALTASPGKGQQWEIHVARLELVGAADQDSYPLQKKRHSDEFLRGIAHLRPRTNKYGAIFRVRSEAAFAVHQFFRDRGYFYLHSPIITGSDCEGAGAMFRVRAAVPAANRTAENQAGPGFFGKDAYLTVSGQLSAEVFASALGQVYTFGPTFRAEDSNTPRHAAEFWMIEPEVAFADLNANMDLAEAFLKGLVNHLRRHCAEDLALFARFVDPQLETTLDNLTAAPFARLPYREAVKILAEAGSAFQFPVGFGCDLQTEHERYLTEQVFKKPVMVFDYPKSIKPFYMRLNDDAETVAAMDVLVPRVGEIIGGSQREERLEVLERRLDELGLRREDYWWYLELRRYGSVPHAGFGMGFERLLMLVTGITNIRDVIPFPRTPKSLEF
ncbi:MAG: asparagine--tRNA ligase [Syntrophobacteraceae bacterium CG2_30_61_12]|nr:MAG: asparagine--tRNA ligase [Syntrophobacteraceae bacterium CG2_30_61_12]